MSIDIAELRRLLTEATPVPWGLDSYSPISLDEFDEDEPNALLLFAAVNALPELLDENDRLVSRLALSGRALEESHQSITEYEKRIAQLEAALRRVRPLIGCDMGEECAEYGHWEDCAIKVAGAIIDGALENKEAKANDQ